MSTSTELIRGRKTGWTKPDRRTRRDYRFTPTVMSQIALGRTLCSNANETDFVEQAIRHYVVSLCGQQPEHRAKEATAFPGRLAEPEHKSGQVESLIEETTQLPSDLHPVPPVRPQTANEKVRRKKTAMRSEPAKEPTRPLDLRQAYQIYIVHEGKTCPTLPEGFCCADEQASGHLCPTHEVFCQVCSIAHARIALERLKKVPGLTRIWLAKNGLTRTSSAGHPTDSWCKSGSAWNKE